MTGLPFSEAATPRPRNPNETLRHTMHPNSKQQTPPPEKKEEET